jgi:pteridine reductase
MAAGPFACQYRVMSESGFANKVVLVTGAARRIGAAIVTRLHTEGARIAVHYRGSADEAAALVNRLNDARQDSAAIFQADLLEVESLPQLVADVVAWGGRLDALVNNASTFYATPIGEIREEHWQDLVGSNFKAPLFLSQAVAPHLREARGAIVNIVDIHAQRPLRDHCTRQWCRTRRNPVAGRRDDGGDPADDPRPGAVGARRRAPRHRRMCPVPAA